MLLVASNPIRPHPAPAHATNSIALRIAIDHPIVARFRSLQDPYVHPHAPSV
jgi:hypothetical protein